MTGAGAGLGRAIARALGDADYRVVCGSRDEDAAQAVVDAIEADGGTAVSVRTDVRDEYDVERCCELAAREATGGIDAVVPVAAVDHSGGADVPLAGDSYAAFDDQVRTNARGVFATVREAVPHLAEGARVVVPVHAFPDGEGGTVAASQAATRSLVRGFAAELPGPVCAVDPGAPVPAFEREGDQGEPSEDGGGQAAEREGDSDAVEAAAAVRWAVATGAADEVDGQHLDAAAIAD